MVGVVESVLVKSNDTVFAGEPMIRLKDNELEVRLAAAEAQVAVRKRLRNDTGATGKTEDRHKAEDAVSDGEQACSMRRMRSTGLPPNGGPAGGRRATLTTARTELAHRARRARQAQGPSFA